MSLMKSLPMVARTEVLRGTPPRNPKSLGAAIRQRREPFAPEGHPQAREREEEEDLRREINHLEGSTLSWRRRKTPSEGKP
jgi:hypothetical protein